MTNGERNRRIGHIQLHLITYFILALLFISITLAREDHIAFSARVSVVPGLLPRSKKPNRRNEGHDAGTRKQTYHECVMLAVPHRPIGLFPRSWETRVTGQQ